MENDLKKIGLDEWLFWDIDFSRLNFEKHKDFIICRVCERGLRKHFQLIQTLFSEEEIVNAVTSAKFIDTKTLYYLSFYYNIPLKNFNSFKSLSSNYKWQ